MEIFFRTTNKIEKGILKIKKMLLVRPLKWLGKWKFIFQKTFSLGVVVYSCSKILVLRLILFCFACARNLFFNIQINSNIWVNSCIVRKTDELLGRWIFLNFIYIIFKDFELCLVFIKLNIIFKWNTVI